jgi:hypothetical protein
MAENEGSKTEEIALETVSEARKSLGMLTKRFLSGEFPESKYRAAVYGFNGLGKLLVHEKAKELETRIAALEKARGTA